MDELTQIWERHRNAEWPRFSSPHQGELMTLDTVIGGCVIFHLESSDGLDVQRRAILENCKDELDALIPELPEEARSYFGDLRHLAVLIRATFPT